MKIKIVRGVRVGDKSVAAGEILSTPGDLSEAQAKGMIAAQKAIEIGSEAETSAVPSKGDAPKSAKPKKERKSRK